MIKIRQIKIDIHKNQKQELKQKIEHILKTNIISYKIIKRSLDARKKPNLYYVYEVDVMVEDEQKILAKNQNAQVLKSKNETYIFKPVNKKNVGKIVIVGAGPAGLFCALTFVEQGYPVIIIERGKRIEERIEDVESFWKTGVLNVNSNVQFGEGGAGTFSDGKLNTLVRDPQNRMRKVYETFVTCGANDDILYDHHPHIGTDTLRNVIIQLRNKIISLGGKFCYQTELTDIICDHGKLQKIEINHQEYITCDTLVLAVGHSARDTVQMLYEKGIQIENKPFAVGVRIQHRQDMINQNQYGSNHTLLPPANYKLTYQASTGRGVYSFCMCPGGFVVNASSERDRLAINGMSNHKRNEENANSAIVVTIGEQDYGKDPLSGIYFQRNLEEKAYQLGSGNIPIQRFEDYLNNQTTTKLGYIKPVMKGNYTLANLNDLFPQVINDSLKEAILYFDNKIPGFSNEDVLLAGVESRTSSPIRMIRNEYGLSNIKGIYPCGEGAGYAGGITTSAMDGIQIAEKIITGE